MFKSQISDLKRPRWAFRAAALLTVLLIAAQPSRGAEGGKPNAGGARGSKSPPASNPLTVPDGSAAELLQFIGRVEAIPPKGDSVEDLQANHARICEAIIAAAERIFAGKPTDKERLAAFQAKFGALLILEQVGDRTAAKRLHDFLNSLKADRQPEISGMAVLTLFSPIDSAYPRNAAEAKHVWEETKSVIAGTSDDQPPSKGFVTPISMAIYIANEMELRPQTLPVALQAYRDLIDLYAKSKNEMVLRQVARCEGAIRRLESLGKPMKLWGTLLDGRPFDPAVLNGKVVLVEVVNLAIPHDPLLEAKRLQKQYHNKGFEVVAILMDDDRERKYFKQFMKEEQISWPVIVDPLMTGKAKYAATLWVYYGLTGDGRGFLLNRKGEVVSLDANREELASKLKELLGEPSATQEPATPNARAQDVAKAPGRVDSKIDPFQVPDAAPDQLLQFIREVQRAPRQARSGDEVWVEQAKVERAVLAAADKILAAQPAGNTRTAAIEAKLDALHVLSYTLKEINETREAAAALKELEASALPLKDDPELRVARAAREGLIRAHGESLSEPNVDLAAAAAVWRETAAHLQSDSYFGSIVADDVAARLASNSHTAALAAQAYRDLIAIHSQRVFINLESHPGWVGAEAAELPDYYGALRRLELTGRPFEIKGILAEGGAFDQQTVNGKVVLVEIGSLHCYGCYVELANVKRNYERYHARGFEVVEVVPEGSRAAVKQFRAEEKVSWPIICEHVFPMSDEPADRGQCGMLQRYGPGGPEGFLLGRDGKVVSINAVGDELGRQLEALLK